jgi:excisionase family DNA binding protein
MTKLLTIPKFAQATGSSYRLFLQLVEAGEIPSVPVGSRRRIDIRWVEQWLAVGGYCPTDRADAADRDTEWGTRTTRT